MWRDTILEEVRAHREALAAEHGHDLKAVVVALRQKHGADGRRVVSFVAKHEPAKPARKLDSSGRPNMRWSRRHGA